MNRVIKHMPNLEIEEANYLNQLLKDKSDEEIKDFAGIYINRRRDPLLILICVLLGFFGFAGLHRFISNSIGLGILYLFTVGLCFIGTIVDLINFKNIAFEYNTHTARKVLILLES